MPRHRPPHEAHRGSGVTIVRLHRTGARATQEIDPPHWRLVVCGAEVGGGAFLEEAQAIAEAEYGVVLWLHHPTTDTYVGEPASDA